MSMKHFQTFQIFDSHFHIINDQFPLIENNGYMPNVFTHQDYLNKTRNYQLCGGAIVSGSFQAFDQTYLTNALEKLGPNFVGVTQLPNTVSDDEILRLNSAGIRAVRFNLKRGGSEQIQHLSTMAHRVHELVGWHVELYVDSKELTELYDTLIDLPSVSIDHLGLSKTGFKCLLKLAEQGVRIKATGFSRVDFDVLDAIKQIYSANPQALMFGTDLPSTRAPKPYTDNDFLLIADNLDAESAEAVFSGNALQFYRM